MSVELGHEVRTDFVYPDVEQFRLEAEEIVVAKKSLLRGHFDFAEGWHADTKADFDPISDDPGTREGVAEMMSFVATETIRLNGLPIPNVVMSVPYGADPVTERIVALLSDHYQMEIAHFKSDKIPETKPTAFEIRDISALGDELAKAEQRGVVDMWEFDDNTTTIGSMRRSGLVVRETVRNEFHIPIRTIGRTTFGERLGSPRYQLGDPPHASIVKYYLSQWRQAACDPCKADSPLSKQGTPLSEAEARQVMRGWQDQA